MTQPFQAIGVIEMWAVYVDKVLKANPEYWAENNRQYSQIPKFYIKKYVSHRSGGQKTAEVMNYHRFRKIITVYFKQVRSRIIQGEDFQLWNQIGSISSRRVERNFAKKAVDFRATVDRGLRNPETGKLVPIYFSTPDWCRIGWNKPKKQSIMLKAYEFAPADGGGKGGFKDEFKKALTENEMLRYTFDYHPYIK